MAELAGDEEETYLRGSSAGLRVTDEVLGFGVRVGVEGCLGQWWTGSGPRWRRAGRQGTALAVPIAGGGERRLGRRWSQGSREHGEVQRNKMRERCWPRAYDRWHPCVYTVSGAEGVK
jgi:hypothetical protein